MSEIEEHEPVTLMVVDHDTVRYAESVPDWDATTLLACLSDDPADWSELRILWPRYQTTLSEASPEDLGLFEQSLDAAVEGLGGEAAWIAIDLLRKRVFAGGGYPEIPRDTMCVAGEETQRGYECQIALHLPPWWELKHAADPEDMLSPRESELSLPDPHRDVLWGQPLVEFIANRIVNEVESPAWHEENCDDDVASRYSFTIAVHRDWLMTPREDLGEKTPRDRLLPGRKWIDLLIDGQRLMMSSTGAAVPISPELYSYKTGPLGTEEICLYFDCCRELIAYGWAWAVKHRGSDSNAELAIQLANELVTLREQWLQSPFEGGSPPSHVIDCERQRVPRLATPGEGGDHADGCDCPICLMIDSESFGPTFVGIDGHHLELDDEFAFSLCESREEWEKQQGEYEEFAAKMDEKLAMREKEREEAGDLASPWEHAHVNWDAMQFGPMAKMAISFLLADMVSSLHDHDCDASEIEILNAAFRDYRDATREEIVEATEAFKTALESVAQRNEFLVSRSADLQSKLDELCRQQSAGE